MSADTPINFVLDYFNTEFTLDQCGQILQQSIPGLEKDALAIYEVKVGIFKDVFRFWSDASDVDGLDGVSDSLDTDVRYYVKLDKWPETLVLNPAHARLEHTVQGVDGNHTTSGEIATGYESDRALVKHDFLRYISYKLFNTHLGVDLFTNEGQMAYNIAKQGHLDGWGKGNADAPTNSIWKTLVAAQAGESDGQGGNKNYYTNDTSNNSNLTRELLAQLSSSAGGRARLTDISGEIYTDGTYPIPFKAGDSVSMRVVLNAAAGQHNLTGVSEIPSRAYQIKVVLVPDTATPANVEPTDDYLTDGTTDVSASYAAVPGRVSTGDLPVDTNKR